MKQQQAVWVTDLQMEQTIAAIPTKSFTIIDFIRAFNDLFPEAWDQLVIAFGLKGDGTRRGYTATVYLGNRLWMMTKKPGSPLLPMVPWQKGGVETPGQRRATPAERAMGAEGIIRVFRKAI